MSDTAKKSSVLSKEALANGVKSGITKDPGGGVPCTGIAFEAKQDVRVALLSTSEAIHLQGKLAIVKVPKSCKASRRVPSASVTLSKVGS